MKRKSLAYPAVPLAWMLLACATMAPAQAPVRTISYETGPCRGACPEYRLVINSDGTGVIFTRLRAAAQTRRPFTATPLQFREFAAWLEPALPANGEVRLAPPNCQTIATDMGDVDIAWFMDDGSTRTLYLEHGCDIANNRALAERLRNPPEALLSGLFELAR